MYGDGDGGGIAGDDGYGVVGVLLFVVDAVVDVLVWVLVIVALFVRGSCGDWDGGSGNYGGGSICGGESGKLRWRWW